MENKKVISTYEFSVYNVIFHLTSEMIYLFILYYVYKKSKEIFAYCIRLLKRIYPRINSVDNSNDISSIVNYIASRVLFSVVILGFYFVLIYFFDLSSFIHIRRRLFTFWKNLFRSDSNITDLDSFQEYYCNSAYNEVNSSDDKKYFSESITFLCGWNAIDALGFQNTLMQVVFISNLVLIVVKQGNIPDSSSHHREVNSINDNNENNRSHITHTNTVTLRLIYYLQFVTFILDQIIKIFLYLQGIYFVVVMLSLLNNYRNIKSLNSASYDNTHYNHNSYGDELHINQYTSGSYSEANIDEYYTHPSKDHQQDGENTSEDQSNNTLGKVIAIILEILEIFLG